MDREKNRRGRGVKNNYNSLGQAAVITHEFLHANSHYEIDDATSYKGAGKLHCRMENILTKCNLY